MTLRAHLAARVPRIAPTRGSGHALRRLALVVTTLVCLALPSAAHAGAGTSITISSPVGGEVLAGGQSLTVTWSSNATNPHKVRIKWSPDNGTTWRQIATGLATSGSHTWTGALSNSAQMRIMAVVVDNAGVESTNSTTSAAFTIEPTPPGPVTGASATPGNGQVTLAWTNPADIDFAGVRIYRSTTVGTLGTLVATVAAGDTPNNSWIDTTASTGVENIYTLAAYDTVGNARETSLLGADTRSSDLRSSSTASDGTTTWLFGGCTACTLTDMITRYDPARDLYTDMAARLPTARYRTKAVYIGGTINKVFVLGGYDSASLSDVLAYDPAADSLAAAGSLPAPRHAGTAVYAPNTGYIYYLGGHDGTAVQSTIFRYDPTTGTAADTGHRLPVAVHFFNASYWPANGCIYTFAGQAASSYTDVIMKYCPATGEVSTVARMPQLVKDTLSVTMSDQIVLNGALTAGPTGQNWIHTFSPETNQIRRHGGTSAVAAGFWGGELFNGMAYYFSPYPNETRAVRTVPGTLLTVTPYTGTSISLTAPAAGSRHAAGGSLTASWTSDSTDTTGTVLQWSCDAGAAWTTIASGLAPTGSYTWSPLPKASSDQCQLRVTHAGALTDTTGAFSIDWTPPGQVLYPQAIIGNGQVTLYWENPADADLVGVRIYQSTIAGALGAQIADVAATPGTDGTYTDGALTNGTEYIYTLVPYDDVGNARETVVLGDATHAPARYAVAAAGTTTRGYMLGGCSSCTLVDEVWRYDSQNETFTKLAATLPSPRYRFPAAYAQNTRKVYAFGGQDASTTMSDVVELDPISESVTVVATLPAPRTQSAAVYAPNTGKIYVLGGLADRSVTPGSATNTIFQFDPVTGIASDTGVQLPVNIHWTASAYWPGDGCIYLLGGQEAGGAHSAAIIRYCPLAGTAVLHATSLLESKIGVSAVALPTGITLFGGANGVGYVDHIDTFDPDSGSMRRHGVLLPVARSFGNAAIAMTGGAHLVGPYPTTTYVTRSMPGSIVSATPSATPPNNAPRLAKHLSPANASTVATGTPTLSAEFRDHDVADTGTVHFEICTVPTSGKATCAESGGTVVDSGSSAPGIAAGTSGSWTPTTALANGTYHWHARGEDNLGVLGPWRPTWQLVVFTGSTLTLVVDATTRSVPGSLLPGNDGVVTTVVSVSTDNPSGYTLRATDESDTWGADLAGSAFIPDWTGTDAAPTLWDGAVSPGYSGLTVRDVAGTVDDRLAKWGPANSTGWPENDFANNYFAGLEGTVGTVLHTTVTASPGTDTISATWRVNPPDNIPPGAYDATISYTAIGNP